MNQETELMLLHVLTPQERARWRDAKQGVQQWVEPDRDAATVLSDWLRGAYDESGELTEPNGVHASLLKLALSRVDWHTVAEKLLAEA